MQSCHRGNAQISEAFKMKLRTGKVNCLQLPLYFLQYQFCFPTSVMWMENMKHIYTFSSNSIFYDYGSQHFCALTTELYNHRFLGKNPKSRSSLSINHILTEVLRRDETGELLLSRKLNQSSTLLNNLDFNICIIDLNQHNEKIKYPLTRNCRNWYAMV